MFDLLKYKLGDAISGMHMKRRGVVVKQHYPDIACVVSVDDTSVHVQ